MFFKGKKDLKDLFFDHLCIVKRFFLDQGKIYHVNHDFLSEISKVKKSIPYELLPEKFCAYLSFSSKTIFFQDDYIQGAYVYLGDSKNIALRYENDIEDPVKVLKVSYISFGGRLFSYYINLNALIKKNLQITYSTLLETKKAHYENFVNLEKYVENEFYTENHDLVFRTIINLICYIHQPDPELKREQPLESYSHKKRSEIRQSGGIQNECTLPITFINWSWQRPVSLHTVAGHLKWQAHGKERSQRKLIWVDPYERGVEVEQKENHNHSL